MASVIALVGFVVSTACLVALWAATVDNARAHRPGWVMFGVVLCGAAMALQTYWLLKLLGWLP